MDLLEVSLRCHLAVSTMDRLAVFSKKEKAKDGEKEKGKEEAVSGMIYSAVPTRASAMVHQGLLVASMVGHHQDLDFHLP
jgi:hypothetical protein